MMKPRFNIVAYFLLLTLSLPVMAEEVTKVWNNEPLTIHIKTGQEIRIIFPTAVELQVPMGITQHLESLAPNPAVVYWRAVQPIESGRILAPSLDGEDLYIIDLIASESGIDQHITIEHPRRVLAKKGSETTAPAPVRDDPAEVILTRFVAQLLYAPERLLPNNLHINQLPTPELPADFPLLRATRGEAYQVEAVGQWFGYDRYITAVMITNQGAVAVPMDMSNVRGRFTHLTPHHRYLGPNGTLEDRTTLYLVSRTPFHSAVMEDGYAY